MLRDTEQFSHVCTVSQTTTHCQLNNSTTDKPAHKFCVKKVKFYHTLYRALGPELISVYRQVTF